MVISRQCVSLLNAIFVPLCKVIRILINKFFPGIETNRNYFIQCYRIKKRTFFSTFTEILHLQLSFYIKLIVLT